MSKIPMMVFLVVILVLSVSRFFVHRLPYPASIAFNAFAIVWGIATTLRAFTELKAIRARAKT